MTTLRTTTETSSIESFVDTNTIDVLTEISIVVEVIESGPIGSQGIQGVAGADGADSDKYVEVVTTDATGYVTVTHNLGDAEFIAQAWSTAGVGETVPSIEFSNATGSTVVVGGAVSTEYKIILIG